MNLQRIAQARRTLVRLEARLGGLLERDLHAELTDALYVVEEAHHFAVCFQDASEVERDNRERASTLREEAITRLVQSLTA